MVLRIGVDGRPLARGVAGISKAVYRIVRELERIDDQNQYFLYSNRPLKLPFDNPRWQKRVQSLYSFIPGSLWLQSKGFARAAHHDHLDVFWGTLYSLPDRLPEATGKVLTIYDLVWRRYPETMSWYTRILNRAFAERSVSGADMIVTISESTKQDLERELGVPTQKIKVVHLGVDAHFRPRDQKVAAQHVAQKYGASENYILFVGTIELRKNLVTLVKAMEILRRHGERSLQLVVVGAKGWKTAKIYESVQRSGLTENDIRFLGFVPEEDLPMLYSGAGLFVFPSLYEGFGLPLVEAMACGVPIVASNTSSIPEVVQDAALLVSPHLPRELAEAILRVRRDADLRRTMIQLGLRRAACFRWDKAAERILECMEKVVARRVPVRTDSENSLPTPKVD